jgi:hypothetical protein
MLHSAADGIGVTVFGAGLVYRCRNGGEVELPQFSRGVCGRGRMGEGLG